MVGRQGEEERNIMNGGSELVQSTLYTSMEFSKGNPLELSTYAN
jgi:hypothetical protein